MSKLLFIYNPLSGKAAIRSHLSRILDIFTKAGYQIEIYPTQGPLDAKEHVMERAGDFDLLVCSGGDGTLNEIVTGIMESGKDIALGYIPSGSTNDFAASLGLPKKMAEAAKTAVSGTVTEVDLGVVNGRYFVYVTGFGAFTDVSYTTPQDIKNAIGHPAYILEGMKTLGKIKPYEMKITWDEGELEGEYILGLITNSKSVGGFKGITGKGVDLGDGLFEVTLVKEIKNPMDFVQLAGYLAGTIRDENYCILHFKTSSLKIEAKQEMDWVLDGEYGGKWKGVEIRNLHRSLKLMSKEESEVR